MNFGSVRRTFGGVGGEGGLIFETNCIFEYKPSPHFRLDVVYKMGGVLMGHYGTYHSKHTAWLLDAECLHYLEHIHNALCLATLSGIDE